MAVLLYLDGSVQPGDGRGHDAHVDGPVVSSDHGPALARVGVAVTKETAVGALADHRGNDVGQHGRANVRLLIIKGSLNIYFLWAQTKKRQT